MADGYELALQKGLTTALKAASGVSALVGARIYDEPPKSVTFPYIRFGDFHVVPFDTDGTLGADITVGIEVHSRPKRGRVECSKIVSAIKNALHRDTGITAVGFTLVEFEYLTSVVTRIEGNDGRSYVGTMAFRALLDG